jgi:hypothetical protein
VEVDDIVVADGVISVNVAPASLVNGVGKLITPAEVNFIVDVYLPGDPVIVWALVLKEAVKQIINNNTLFILTPYRL